MLIYGKNTLFLAQMESSVPCPICKDVNMQYKVYSKYVHLYWIPCLPYDKIKCLECHHCKNAYTISEEHLNENERKKLDELYAKSSAPWYSFAFPILVVGIACVTCTIEVYSKQHIKQMNQEFLARPYSAVIVVKSDHPALKETPYLLVDIEASDDRYLKTRVSRYGYSLESTAKQAWKTAQAASQPSDTLFKPVQEQTSKIFDHLSLVCVLDRHMNNKANDALE
ncbi:MAG: hypothetical protein K0S74_1848 [Chlamydiales bacterium]|jgi:hypothetical protein|nr:hypothetical protein [Chlamydiales bacterium]